MKKESEIPESGRPYAGERPGERVLRRRQQFLDAGLELFGSIGYRATTVRILCKQAKLTDRYFYESFTSTEDLLVEVYRNCLSELQRKVLQAISTERADPSLASIIHDGLDAFFEGVENSRAARVIWLEILGISPRVDQIYNAGINGFATLFLGLARSLYPHWKINDEEGQIIALAVIGAASQSAMAWLLSDYKASRSVMVSATSRVFLGLVAGIERDQS